MEERFEYQVGERTFYQVELSLYQTKEVAKLLEGKELPEVNEQAVIQTLGGGIIDFLMIVLVPKEMPLKDHIEWLIQGNLEDRRKEFLVYGKLHLPVHVVRDFFECNQISSLTEIIGNLGRQVMSTLSSAGMLKPSGSAPISEAETPAAA